MPRSTTDQSLADRITDQIDELVREAEEHTHPLEIDPYRDRLFELFVTAEGAGLIRDGADPDLTADGLGRELAARWDLADAARASVQQQAKMPPEHLSKMRMLWSFMRMWMEWSYAWQRWPEFHGGGEEGPPATGTP